MTPDKTLGLDVGADGNPPLFLSNPGLICFTGGGGKTTSMLRLAARLTQHSSVIVTTTTRMAASEADPKNVLLVKDFPALSSPEFLSGIKNLLADRGAAFLFRDMTENGEKKYVGLSTEEVSSLHGMNLASWMLVEADGASHMPLKGYAEYEPPLPESFDCQIVVVGADAMGRPMNEFTTARFEILRRFLGVERDAPLTPPLLLRLLTSPDMYLKNSPQARRVLCVNKSDLTTPDALAPWVAYLRSHLSQYQGILVTGRDEENFYPMLFS